MSKLDGCVIYNNSFILAFSANGIDVIVGTNSWLFQADVNTFDFAITSETLDGLYSLTLNDQKLILIFLSHNVKMYIRKTYGLD